MAKRESVTVRLTIDPATLNEYLGNIGKTPLRKGVAELLGNLFDSVPFYCERCGTSHSEETGVKGSFEILD